MLSTLNRLFVDHPREVGESYIHHAAAASRFSLKLARLSGCAFLHALVPGVHKTTVSTEVKRMADEMGYRAEIARESQTCKIASFDPGL